MHHKLLYGTTALVGAGLLMASASPAKAQLEVTLGGYSEFGWSTAGDETFVDGAADRGHDFFMDNELQPTVEGTSDSGITYGTGLEIEVGSGSADSTVSMDEAVLFFSGLFGRVEVGRDDGAEDVMFVGGEDTQAGTGGIDGDIGFNFVPMQIQDSGDSAKVTYFTPRVGGFQLGASFVPDEGDDGGLDDGDDFSDSFGFGGNWEGSFDGFDLILSATGIIAENEDDDEDDKADWSVGGRMGLGGLQFGAAFIQRTDANEADIINVGAGYSFGPASASVGYVYHDPDDGDEQNLFAVSGDYGILPGVALKGDITYSDEDPGASDDDSIGGVVTVQISY